MRLSNSKNSNNNNNNKSKLELKKRNMQTLMKLREFCIRRNSNKVDSTETFHFTADLLP